VSIEYEVRSDDSYSRHVSASVARGILQANWNVTESSAGFFLYQGGRCHVEIELGAEDAASPGEVQWVGLRVPAGAKLESATRAVELGISLAQQLGWRLFDAQSGSYIQASDLLPPPPFREAIVQLGRDVISEPVRSLGTRVWLRGRRQSLRSIGAIAFGALLLVFVSDRFIGFGFGERLGLSFALVAGVSTLIVVGDILLDVLGEVRTEADARRASSSHHAE
jgi:hypothetical protein